MTGLAGPLNHRIPSGSDSHSAPLGGKEDRPDVSFKPPSNRSNATRRHVAVHLAFGADEQDAMSGRISFIPFHFLVGNRDSRPVRDDALAVRNDGDVLIAFGLEVVGFESVSFAAAREILVVGLHEILKPLAQRRRLISPLSVVAG